MAPVTEPEKNDPAACAPESQGSSFRNLQKERTGLTRVWFAAGHSLAGLKSGWGEPAFRAEALLAAALLPVAWWLGRSWVETALLAGSVMGVLIVELLNSGIESAIDRVGLQWHPLSKRAKDLGSAAVLLSLLVCVGIWAAALVTRFG